MQPSLLAWATAENLWEVSAPSLTLKFWGQVTLQLLICPDFLASHDTKTDQILMVPFSLSSQPSSPQTPCPWLTLSPMLAFELTDWTESQAEQSPTQRQWPFSLWTWKRVSMWLSLHSPPRGILFKYFGKAHLCHCVWYRNTFQNYRSNTPLIFLQCLPQHITFSNLLFARIPAIECELHPQKTLLSLVSSAKSLTPKLLSYT